MFRRLSLSLFAVLLLAVLFVRVPCVFADEDTTTQPNQTTQTPAATTPVATTAPVDKTTQILGGAPEQITLTPEEQKFVELTNASRRDKKLPELTVAPLLVKIAREKSKEMHDLNYWGHTSPITEKRTAMTRVLYYLPEKPLTMTVGENLYFCNQVLVDEGHQALMASPTHRKNILKPEYKYIGIGTYISDDKRFWTTEIFLTIQYKEQ